MAKVTLLSLDAIESTDQGQAAVVTHLHEEAVTFDRLENAVDHSTLSQINLGLGFSLARFQDHELKRGLSCVFVGDNPNVNLVPNRVATVQRSRRMAIIKASLHNAHAILVLLLHDHVRILYELDSSRGVLGSVDQFLGQVDDLLLVVNVKNDTVDLLSGFVLALRCLVLIDDQSCELAVHLND